jgi:type IV pilus biogenesis protein CpaD/CtpE
LNRSTRLATRGGALLLAAAIVSALGGCASNDSKSSAKIPPESRAQPICQPAVASSVKDTAAVLPENGCWNAANLAKMVADPRDLAEGKPLGPANGARESVAIEAYERSQPTPLNAPGSARPTLTISGGSDTGGN